MKQWLMFIERLQCGKQNTNHVIEIMLFASY